MIYNYFTITNNTLLKQLITRTEFINLSSYNIDVGENLYEIIDNRLYYGDENNNKLPYTNWFLKRIHNFLIDDVFFDTKNSAFVSNIYPNAAFLFNIDFPVILKLKDNDKLSLTQYVKNGINELYGGISYNRGSKEYNLVNPEPIWEEGTKIPVLSSYYDSWKYAMWRGYTAYYSFGYIPNKLITLNRLASFGDIKLHNDQHKLYINFCEINLPENIDFNYNNLIIVMYLSSSNHWMIDVYLNNSKILTHDLYIDVTTYV